MSKNKNIYEREDYSRLLEYLANKWQLPNIPSNKKILFDITGQFLPANNFYSLIALKVFSSLGLNIDLLTTTSRSLNLKIFESLKVKIFHLKNIKNSITSVFFILCNISSFIKLLRQPSKIYDLDINGLFIGDLIVDEYIRRSYNCTVSKMDKSLFLLVVKALYLYHSYKHILRPENAYEYIVINCNAYIQQGMLARLSVLSGAKVVYMRSLSVVRVMCTLEDVYRYEFRPNENLFYKIFGNQKIEETANSFFKSRVLEKKNIGWDGNNFIYSRQNLDIEATERFRENIQNKNVVLIVAPSLMDGVFGNYGKAQVYKDNYTWLVETLKVCVDNENIVTFLKPHPGDKVYPSMTSIGVLKEMRLDDKIAIWPEEIDMLALADCIKLAITSRGSVAREFPCFGVPVLTFGEGAYTGFNTAIEPKTVGEYADIILNAHRLQRLDKETKKRAMLLYFLYQNYRYEVPNKCNMHVTDDTFKEYDEGKHLMGENIEIDDFKDDAYDILVNKLDFFMQNCFSQYYDDFANFLADKDEMHFGEKNILFKSE